MRWYGGVGVGMCMCYEVVWRYGCRYVYVMRCGAKVLSRWVPKGGVVTLTQRKGNSLQ